jgi:hypothetical protein
MRYAYTVLVEKTEGRMSFGKARLMSEDNMVGFQQISRNRRVAQVALGE